MGGGLVEEPASPISYAEQFRAAFPYYLLIGMTERQYWDGDCTLTRAYRKADELRNERKNQELWLQGMYIYEAFLDVSPMLHAFAKRPKPHEYRKEPYPITKRQIAREKNDRAEVERLRSIAFFQSWAKANQDL